MHDPNRRKCRFASFGVRRVTGFCTLTARALPPHLLSRLAAKLLSITIASTFPTTSEEVPGSDSIGLNSVERSCIGRAIMPPPATPGRADSFLSSTFNLLLVFET
jgi:hypothetical protein